MTPYSPLLPDDADMTAASKKQHSKETLLERRICELRHHLHIESAVLVGATNAIKLLQSTKSQDKKALQEVSG